MAASKHICEFGTIWNAKEFQHEEFEERFDTIFLDDKSFVSLKNFVAENNDPNSEVEQAFSLHRQKGKDFIRVKNYVGVVETRQGTVIEILPKIYRPQNRDESDKVKESKHILLKMLRSLRNTPFKSIDRAHLKARRLPIIEIFISVFLKEMEILLKRGIKHFYSAVEENQNYLKGRIVFHDNLKQNLIHRERFFVRHDEFKSDIPQNRILKTALVYLMGKSKSTKNISQINNFLCLFDEVCICKNLEKDLQTLQGQNRLFNHYSTALGWAKVFLQNKSFTSYKGKHLNTAILFPMEVLFESYVARKLKQAQPELDISAQDRKHYLLSDLNMYQQKFRLRPDLVVQQKQLTIVADTKWKIINQNQSSKNYNISQSDMYQLFAYGKKYQRNNGSVHLVLIYPKHAEFDRHLHFEYEDKLRIDAVPFDFWEENECLCIFGEDY